MHCWTKEKYIQQGYTFIENNDGTVSLFDDRDKTQFYHESKPCCEALGYIFDIENQKCMWSTSSSPGGDAGGDSLFKVLLNPQGNESTLFVTEENETCCLDISFDFLFRLTPETVQNVAVGKAGTFQFSERLLDLLNLINRQQDIVNDVEKDCAKLEEDLANLEENQAPYVLELHAPHPNDSNNGDYCLTDEGVGFWEQIIGPQKYSEWLNIDGQNINNIYGWQDVQSLLDAESTPGQYMSLCGYKPWSRAETQADITMKEFELEDCQNRLQHEQDDLETLQEGLPDDAALSCNSYAGQIENLDVSFTIEKDGGNGFETIFESQIFNIGSGNLYNHINSTNGESGILLSGTSGIVPPYSGNVKPNGVATLVDVDTANVRNSLRDDLYEQYLAAGNSEPTTDAEWEQLDNKFSNWYQGCWLSYENKICDQAIIDQIENEKINFSIKVNSACGDFGILLDRIKINRDCTKVDNVEKFISEPPKFEIIKVCDNKKSWIANKDGDERFYGLRYRGTEYETKHHKLVINTKEIELNLSPARAVEEDFWCYMRDNDCVLDGCTESESEPITYTGFTCPAGYTEESDGETCTKITTSAATLNGSLFTVGIGYELGAAHYMYMGTIFAEDITNKPWPIAWGSKGKNNTWRGPYYNVGHMVDYNGDPIIHTGFGTHYDDDGTLLWASPEAFNGRHSKFGLSLAPYHSDGDPNPNILWGGGQFYYQTQVGTSSGTQFWTRTPVTEGSDFYNDLGGGHSNGGLDNDNTHIPGVAVGPLMRAGVWAEPYAQADLVANNQWIGFSRCLILEETKTYRFGFVADDNIRIKINGEWLLYNEYRNPNNPNHHNHNPALAPGELIEGLYSPDLGGDRPTFTLRGGGRSTYTVVGITLQAGKNYIEMQGVNRGGGPVGFVAELYDATQEELMNMRYESELKSVTVWSTADEVGNTFPLGSENGYSCSDRYNLNTCLPPPYACDKVEKTGLQQDLQEFNIGECCCPGNPLFAKDYENRTTLLPLQFSTDTGALDSITPGGAGFSCPVGFTAINENTLCVYSATTTISASSIVYTAETGDRDGSAFGWAGTRFYDNVDNYTLPLVARSTTDGRNAVDFGDQSSITVWNGLGFSTLNSTSQEANRARLVDNNGTGVPIPFELVNVRGSNGTVTSPWTNPENGTIYGTALQGRLNRCGVWTTATGATSFETPPFREWIGFSRCVELDEEKVYYFGFGADNGMRVKINGVLIAEWGGSKWCKPLSPALSACTGTYSWAGTSEEYGETRYFNAWHVIPITLNAGPNYIELEGWNNGLDASFGAEIYDAPDYDTLKYLSATYVSTLYNPFRYYSTQAPQYDRVDFDVPELEPYIVWSTRDRVGEEFDLGENSGYSCPSGWVKGCDGTECVEIEYADISGSSGESLLVPCGAVVDLLSGITSGSTTTIQKLQTKDCGEVYAIGQWTGDTTFDGYWIGTENDGTLGVYDVFYNSGSTVDIDNVSTDLDCFCCETFGDIFEAYADKYDQGVYTYPQVAWDPNKERCVYRKCGDDCCINFDLGDLSEINSDCDELGETLASNLIDAKNRQTISAYPTLRMIYDRYNNNHAGCCDVESSSFDYYDMDDFGKTVGDYWVDLIEQVVPATSIWESTYEYRNTVFDTQKFQYKRTNTFVCDDPSKDYPFSAVSKEDNIGVITQIIPAGDESVDRQHSYKTCDTVWLMTTNRCNSEFIGRVTDFLGEITHDNVEVLGMYEQCLQGSATTIEVITDTPVVVAEVPCDFSVELGEVTQTDIGQWTATIDIVGDTVGPLLYTWTKDGDESSVESFPGQTITGLTAGTYTISVGDTGNPGCGASTVVEIPAVDACACWYTLPEETQHVINQTTAPILTPTNPFVQTFSVLGITINGDQYFLDEPYSEIMSADTTSSNINWISANNDTVSGATTGLTYTNFVEFLNNFFKQIEVNGRPLYPTYNAQISTAVTTTSNSFQSDTGFYIVRPCNDTFEFLLDNQGVGSWDKIYTNDSHGTLTDGGITLFDPDTGEPLDARRVAKTLTNLALFAQFADTNYEDHVCGDVCVIDDNGVVDDAATAANIN